MPHANSRRGLSKFTIIKLEPATNFQIDTDLNFDDYLHIREMTASYILCCISFNNMKIFGYI